MHYLTGSRQRVQTNKTRTGTVKVCDSPYVKCLLQFEFSLYWHQSVWWIMSLSQWHSLCVSVREWWSGLFSHKEIIDWGQWEENTGRQRETWIQMKHHYTSLMCRAAKLQRKCDLCRTPKNLSVCVCVCVSGCSSSRVFQCVRGIQSSDSKLSSILDTDRNLPFNSPTLLENIFLQRDWEKT